MKIPKNFFEALGKSLDADVQEFMQAIRINANEKKNVSIGDAVRDLLKRAGQDVELRSIGSEFEYKDILEWVRGNAFAKSNKFYIIKAKPEKFSDGVLCVFFGKDDTILTSEKYPKICYVYTSLNPTIEDLFDEGDSVYVKSIKFV